MRAVLVVSLTLNLLFLGFMVGAAVKGPPETRSGREASFGPLSQALTREDRRALRRAFLAEGAGSRDARAVQMAEIGEITTLLRADPIDEAALRAVLDRGAARASARQELGRKLILEHIVTMTPADRRAFADRLEAGQKRREH
jgi:uncharacterized membrane protein